MNPRILSAFLFTLGATACGSDGGGVSSNKKLSELTLEERRELCRANLDDLDDVIAGSCTLAGLDAKTPDECEMTRGDCEKGIQPTTVMEACDSGMGADLGECTSIRVGQYVSCIDEAKAFFSSLSCDTAGQEPATPPSCLQTIATGCPAILGGGS